MMDCIRLIDINFPEPGKKKEALLPGRVCWYKGNSIKQQLRHSTELPASTESLGDFSVLLSCCLAFRFCLVQSLCLRGVIKRVCSLQELVNMPFRGCAAFRYNAAVSVVLSSH